MEKDTLWAIADPNYETSVWFSNSVLGLQEAAARLHLKLRVIPDLQQLGEQAAGTVVVLISDKLEWTQFMVNRLRSLAIKIVLVGAAPDDFGEDVSGVVLDRQAMIAHMVQYFCDAGRYRLASVGNEENAINDMIRKRAFLQVTKAHGLPTSNRDVYIMRQDLDDCITHFLDRAQEYDGAICVNDYVAVQLLAEAKRRGIRVPEDLFVSGSGNMLIGHCTTPTLTTTTLNYREMGIQTVNIWHYLRKNPGTSAVRVLIPCELICRGSTNHLPLKPFERELRETARLPREREQTSLHQLWQLENCLIHCDTMDFGIIRGVVEGESSEHIAERLFAASGTVHYRLKKMYQTAGVGTRKEFERLLAFRITNVATLDSFYP